jgi:hypothetical protein
MSEERFELGEKVVGMNPRLLNCYGKTGIVVANNCGELLPYNVAFNGRDPICLAHSDIALPEPRVWQSDTGAATSPTRELEAERKVL